VRVNCYRDHASEAGSEAPPVPIFLSKFRNALDGPFDPIVLPRISEQSDTTASMVFSVAETIAFLSSIMTLEPGDIIATGTPAGVGFKREPPMFLHDGDVVEVEIEGVGTIRNLVVSGTVRSGS
jgi:2-keto-4-pentenoate hydratase/2-oxohepta-3-ene-1,7-dioic acid hydratase in catechol pathway